MGPARREPCGTPAAIRWHYRHHEPLCEACLAASRPVTGVAAGAQYQPDPREKRNGLPFPVAYIYRGAGYDQITGECDECGYSVRAQNHRALCGRQEAS